MLASIAERGMVKNLMHFKKLQDCKHDVIDITKTRSLTLLSMMEATSPIDSNVTEVVI
jgi:hypothetical protein